MSVMRIEPQPCPALNAGHFPHLSTGIFPRDEIGGDSHKESVRDGGLLLVSNTLESVLGRIDHKLGEMGMSDREASLSAVGKPDLIRDMRRGKGIPRGDRLAALAGVLGTTSDWLLNGGVEGAAEHRARQALIKVKTEVGAADASEFRHLREAQDALPPLPLLGTALAGDTGMPEAQLELVELDFGEVLDYLHRPVSLAGDRDAYALTILSDSMFPRFSPGERVAVSPRAPVSIGDDVIIQLRGPRPANDEPNADRVKTVLIKRLLRRSASHVELQQFNPDTTLRIPSERVAAIHKVSGVMF